MRILFIGTVEFSLQSLKKLVEMGSDIIGVCTKEASSLNSDFADLRPLCELHAIPHICVDNINATENIRWIKSLSPDIIFCFGWSWLIKKELLNVPPMGVIGFHPTKLPHNRGKHPLIWTLVLGLKTSASTFFFMNEGIDDGDILSQVDFSILYEDDAQSLYDKIVAIALNQIEDFVPKLQRNDYQRVRQDTCHTNIWRKRGQNDGLIDFRMSSSAIYNLVRGLSTPYVGAHVRYANQDVLIWKVEVIEENTTNIEPGKILESNNNEIIVKAYDNAIRIVEHNFQSLPKIGEYL